MARWVHVVGLETNVTQSDDGSKDKREADHFSPEDAASVCAIMSGALWQADEVR